MRPSRLFLPASFLLLILAGPQIAQAQSFLTEWGTFGTGNGQFDTPSQIATDAAGNVYIADRQNHRIQKFSNTGVYITQWGSLGTGDGQFNSPSGIATNAEVSASARRARDFMGLGLRVSRCGGARTISVEKQYAARVRRMAGLPRTHGPSLPWAELLQRKSPHRTSDREATESAR